MTMNILNFQVKVAKARRAIRNGKEYLVAPIALINPGVLEGSKGKLYYPPEEVSRNVKSWDRLPLTLYHPQSEDGKHVSARSPGVLDRQGIGFTEGSTYNGKLRTLGWFDVAKIQNPHPSDPLANQKKEVYQALNRGLPIEQSTGLFTSNEPARPGDHFKGREYDYVAKDYRPDHVAVLPGGQIGACSINDGCGVGVVNKNFVVNSNYSDVFVCNGAWVENDGGGESDSSQSLRTKVKKGPAGKADSALLDHDRLDEGGLKLNEDDAVPSDSGGDVTNAWSDEARQAAAAARASSRMAKETSDKAYESGNKIDHLAAQQAHTQAAAAHSNAMHVAGRAGDHAGENKHDRVREEHEETAEKHYQRSRVSNAAPVAATIQRQRRTAAADKSEVAIRLGSDANQSDSPALHRKAAEAHGQAADLYAGAGAQHSAEQHSKEQVRHATAASLLENALGRNQREAAVTHNDKQTILQKLGEMLGLNAVRRPGSAVRKTDGGAPIPGKNRPTAVPAFERPDEELDENDAPAELVGFQATHDGRNTEPVVGSPDTGVAGRGDQGSTHRYPAELFKDAENVDQDHFDARIYSDKKTGFSRAVVVGNAWSQEAREAAAEARSAKGASAKADQSGSMADHRDAAVAHLQAASAHTAAGNTKQASAHVEQAKGHMDKADAIGKGNVRNEQAPLLTVTNADGSSSVVVNPAVSEDQRKYLNWAFGPKWVRDHLDTDTPTANALVLNEAFGKELRSFRDEVGDSKAKAVLSTATGFIKSPGRRAEVFNQLWSQGCRESA